MPAATHGKKKLKNKDLAQIDNQVGNYEKHPYFIKKAAEAKAFLKKAGLPKDIKPK